MSATQELIAAALTACDVAATDYEGAYRAKRELREACARAMVQPDMAEVERLVDKHAEASALLQLARITDPNIADRRHKFVLSRTALLDYVRGVLAERDALMLEFCPQEMTEVQKEKWARNQQPIGATEVPMPQGYAERPSDYTGGIWIESQMRTYVEAREAAGYAAGVTSGAKQMFDYIQFAAANTSDTEWDTRLCELSQDALEAVSPAAHTEWKTIQRVASESRTAGEAAGYARALRESGERLRSGREILDAALRGEVKP